ncbi:MAG: ABC transporter ATP-binding protein [Rhodospirillales bacterium]
MEGSKLLEAGEGNGGRGGRGDPEGATLTGAAMGAPLAAVAEPGAGLRLDGVHHAYVRGDEVVRGVSLCVGKGEIVCLLGPSGCGKTTLLRLSAGLERLQTGRIEVGGRIVADTAAGVDHPPEARRVGLMFQDYALFPHLTVAENVRFGIAATAAGKAWTGKMLERTGLSDYADAYPHTLSGGQQQRCALLRALAPRPELLLLDEPFSGLDVGLRARVREETAAFLREMLISTLIVTHDPEEAMALADRILLMRHGRIVQQGAPSELYLAPVDPYVAEMFGPLNRWEGTVVEGGLDTPAGRFPADGLADGAKAVVLIRPEAISIRPGGDDAVVVESRLLGSLSAVAVVTDAGNCRLRALVPGVHLPTPGTRVGVAVDPARSFVFAAS